MQAAYWTILLALCVGAAIFRPPVIIRALGAILGCGVASLSLAPLLVWPSDNYAFAMMAVDVVAGIIILRPPPSLGGAVIGATYLTQIGLHAGRIIHGSGDMSSYYLGLSFMAFVQLAVVAGWWLDEGIVRRRIVRRKRALAAAADRQGDAP